MRPLLGRETDLCVLAHTHAHTHVTYTKKELVQQLFTLKIGNWREKGEAVPGKKEPTR